MFDKAMVTQLGRGARGALRLLGTSKISLRPAAWFNRSRWRLFHQQPHSVGVDLNQFLNSQQYLRSENIPARFRGKPFLFVPKLRVGGI